ncbi:MAG: hypothetical protein ACRBFS_20970 [Aureispira sp.]
MEKMSSSKPLDGIASALGGKINTVYKNIKGALIKGSYANDENEALDHAKWGDDDSWPIHARKYINESTILSGSIPFKADMLTAGGVAVGKMIEGDDGELYFNEIISDEFESWKKKFDFNLFLSETALDLVAYGSAYPQALINKTDRKIGALVTSASRAWNCRLGKQDKKTGAFETLFISTDFQESGGLSTDNVQKIPLVNMLFNPAQWIKDRRDKKNQFAFRLYIPDLGNTYYPLPFWYSCVDNGWYEVSANIVNLRKNILKNSGQIKYQFKIHTDYWALRFGSETWGAFTSEEREAKRREVCNAFNDFLQKPDNTQAYLMTGKVDFEPHISTDKVKDLVEIIPMKVEYPEGVFSQDSQEASTHMLAAGGVHPSTFGATPSSNLGGNGGSDMRMAYNQGALRMRSYQELITRLLDIVRDVNEWDPKLVFRVRNSMIQTLDIGEHSAPTVNGARKPASDSVTEQ